MDLSKPHCFYVDATMNPDGKGFIPCIVIQDESGLYPMGDPNSNGVDQPLAWRWGNTLEEAEKACADANARMDVTPEMATEIVVSSMAASNARGR